MKKLKELVAEAKKKITDPDVLKVLEELEADETINETDFDVSLHSRVTGTLLTWVLCQESRTLTGGDK